MNFDDYQQQAARTLLDSPGFELTVTDVLITLATLYLVADVGTLADMVKKQIYHRHGINNEALVDQVARIQQRIATWPIGKPDDTPTGTQSSQMMRWWNALGLAGESGEVVGDILEQATPNLQGELGDALWYLSALATRDGIMLDNVSTANIAKLKARYPDGYSSEASIARSEQTATESRLDLVQAQIAHCQTEPLSYMAAHADAERRMRRGKSAVRCLRKEQDMNQSISIESTAVTTWEVQPSDDPYANGVEPIQAHTAVLACEAYVRTRIGWYFQKATNTASLLARPIGSQHWLPITVDIAICVTGWNVETIHKEAT